MDLKHNALGTRVLTGDCKREQSEKGLMNQARYTLDEPRRKVVVEAIQEVCQHRDWNLVALHARSTHVHAVVEARVDPERILVDFTRYASRRLTRMGFDARGRKRWARHGSTRWLKNPEQVSAAVRYVVDEQGEPMLFFEYCGI